MGRGPRGTPLDTNSHTLTLVDTSAWVEFLRATGSATHRYVRELLAQDRPLATTEVIVMEVLAGARDDTHLHQLRRLLLRCRLLTLQGLADYEVAATLYRTCRREGETVRRLTDCLIAVQAIRENIPVLHVDRDFTILGRYTNLRALTAPNQDDTVPQ